jgi:hypothetical protein
MKPTFHTQDIATILTQIRLVEFKEEKKTLL